MEMGGIKRIFHIGEIEFAAISCMRRDRDGRSMGEEEDQVRLENIKLDKEYPYCTGKSSAYEQGRLFIKYPGRESWVCFETFQDCAWILDVAPDFNIVFYCFDRHGYEGGAEGIDIYGIGLVCVDGIRLIKEFGEEHPRIELLSGLRWKENNKTFQYDNKGNIIEIRENAYPANLAGKIKSEFSP